MRERSNSFLMVTQTKSCLLPLKKRLLQPPFLHLQPSEIETMNICKIIMGHVFATTYLAAKNSSKPPKNVHHLITLSGGKKKIPSKKKLRKMLLSSHISTAAGALLTVIVFPPRPYSILLLMSMRVMSIRSTALHFKFPRRNSLLFFVLCPTLWYFCTTQTLSYWA